MERRTKIQFRAWDKINKRWIEDYNEVTPGYYPGEKWGTEHPSGGVNHLSVCVDTGPDEYCTLCLFTGLKDKNGREIYEGDIIQCLEDISFDMEMIPKGKGEVIFLEGIWYASGSISNGLYDVNNCYVLEIIGNIHENPELLEVTQ